jgi:hypothetical protein
MEDDEIEQDILDVVRALGYQDGQLENTVRKSIMLNVMDQDQAAVHLAVTYARLIDTDPFAVVKVGPLLLRVLEALLMTPRARATVEIEKGVDDVRGIVSPLDELRQRRAGRQG